MDSDRFDRWTKLFAQRLSRRTAAAAFGAATIASLSSPRWALGQDDDDDNQDDDDQNTDDQGSDDQNNDDQGSDDQNTSDQDGDDGDNLVGRDACLDVVSCKKYRCIDSVNPDGSGDCSWVTVGDIPGGPYEQEWQWWPPACVLLDKSKSFRELEALCNATYPGENRCNNQCAACATVSIFACN